MRNVLAFALIPTRLLGQAQPVSQTTAKPGWQWTMDSVNTVINAVRAGRTCTRGLAGRRDQASTALSRRQ